VQIFFLYPELLFSQDLSTPSLANDSLSVISSTDSLNAETEEENSSNNKSSSQPDTLIKYYSDRSFFSDNKLVLVGNAKLIYKKTTLTADSIKVDLESDLVYANHSLDTMYYDEENGLIDTIMTIGTPMINNDGEIIYGSKMVYNLKSKKGKVENSTTGVSGKSETDSTFLKMNNLIMLENKDLNGLNCQISSCNNIEHPHYHFRADSIIVKNDNWVFAKPITLYFGNVPLGWFPYILYKMVKGRKSGLIFPSYSYSSTKGNGLKHLGYFQDISEYMDYTIIGDFWDYYGYEVLQKFRYNKRYILNGYLSAEFTNNHKSHDWWFKATHNHNITPTTRLDVNVNYVTKRSLIDELAENDFDKMNNRLYSNFQFNKRWNNTGDNFTLRSNYTQYIDTALAKYTFPNVRYNLSGRKPFKSYSKLPKFLKDYSVSGNLNYKSDGDVNYDVNTYNTKTTYNSSASHSIKLLDDLKLSSTQTFSGYFLENRTNEISSSDFVGNDIFNVDPYTLKDDDKSIIISNSLSYRHKVLSYINVTEKINYKKDIAFRYLNNNTIQTRLDTINSIKTRDIYSMSVSSDTKVYGIFQPNIGSLHKIRHMITPSVSLVYQPDFSELDYGYYNSALDTNGVSYNYDSFGNSLIGSTPSGEQMNLSFNLKNSFDAKILTGKDKYFRPNLFILDFSESYNFAADSNRLSPITVRFSSKLYDGTLLSLKSDTYIKLKLTVNANTIITPYDETVQKNYINENFDFWNENPFRIESYRADYSISLPFGIKEKFSRFMFKFDNSSSDYDNEDNIFLDNDEDEYVDDTYPDDLGEEEEEEKHFERSDFIDLSNSEKLAFRNLTNMELDLSGTLNFRERYGSSDYYSKSFHMNLYSMIKPTENWEVGYRMTINFLLNKEITSTSLIVKRKIHCWEAQFDWDLNRNGFKLLISTTSDTFKDLKFDKDTQRW